MLEAIRKRRSIREYSSKPVEKEKLDEVLKAAMFAPTAHHSRSWEFVVVQDKETKTRLSVATDWAGFAKQASVIIVICSKPDSYWVENCSIAAQNIYLEATDQGLGTCFIQLNRQMIEIKGRNSDLLKIPKDHRVLCLMPLGYPAEKIGEHQDSEFDLKKIHLGKW